MSTDTRPLLVMPTGITNAELTRTLLTARVLLKAADHLARRGVWSDGMVPAGHDGNPLVPCNLPAAINVVAAGVPVTMLPDSPLARDAKHAVARHLDLLDGCPLPPAAVDLDAVLTEWCDRAAPRPLDAVKLLAATAERLLSGWRP